MESWQSVTSAVELGHLRVLARTIADSPAPVLDDSQAIVFPTYRGSIVTASMDPEKALASPLPRIQRVSSTAEFSSTIASDDQALSPRSAVELPSLGVSLGGARFQCTLGPQRP